MEVSFNLSLLSETFEGFFCCFYWVFYSNMIRHTNKVMSACASSHKGKAHKGQALFIAKVKTIMAVA